MRCKGTNTFSHIYKEKHVSLFAPGQIKSSGLLFFTVGYSTVPSLIMRGEEYQYQYLYQHTRVQLVLLVWDFTLFLSFSPKHILTYTHTVHTYTHRYPSLSLCFIHPDSPSHTSPLSKDPKFNYCQRAAGDTAAQVQLKEILTRNMSSKYIMKVTSPQAQLQHWLKT